MLENNVSQKRFVAFSRTFSSFFDVTFKAMNCCVYFSIILFVIKKTETITLGQNKKPVTWNIRVYFKLNMVLLLIELEETEFLCLIS